MIKKIYLFMILGFVITSSAFGVPHPQQDERVQRVYEYFQGQLLWIQHGALTPCAETLLATLSHVDQDGLWQEAYTPLVKAIKTTDLTSSEGQKRADELLTLGALNYISDMKGGRINPHAVAKNIHLTSRAIDAAEELIQYKSRHGQCGWIHELAPATPEYERLKALLATTRQKKGLKASADKRIRSIIVNMERHRWYPSPLPARYIQVNIPGFYLKAVQGGEPAFFMPIIIGKEGTKTPVFNAYMKEVIFNPSWHVPASIARELRPKMASNPGAFARKGYRVTESGRIVQSPGPSNALGKIRFTLDSPFAIYLHGTPQKSLFAKRKRALSHGCIRVKDPQKLAAFVLHNPDRWSSEQIKRAASGTRTSHVKLDMPVLVYITYFTVHEDENGKMQFADDLYGQDKAIWNALEKLKRRNQ